MGSKALDLIAAERERQKSGEGWTAEHDDAHTDGSLAHAAAAYAMPGDVRSMFDEFGGNALWPESWGIEWFKPTPHDRVRELVKAGALIVAEIERLQRKESDHAS